MMKYSPPTDLAAMFRLGADNISTPIWVPDAEDGKILNVGCGEKKIINAYHLDLPEWNADKEAIPFGDDFFASVYAIHFLEHVKKPVKVLREIQRVLRPGGHLNVVVPYYSSQIAYHDLDHKSFWCEDTWKHLFQTKYYKKDHEDWQFEIGANFIMGVAERNMMLFTQLVKQEEEW
jgi:ubiquinone/menaquinone biosynthesis C-methylase UbiE